MKRPDDPWNTESDKRLRDELGHPGPDARQRDDGHHDPGESEQVDSAVRDRRHASTAAIAQRPAQADHIGVLPALRVIDLDYPAAAVGSPIAAGMDWRAAHAINAGRPTAGWPSGRTVITTTPVPYPERGVEIIIGT